MKAYLKNCQFHAISIIILFCLLPLMNSNAGELDLKLTQYKTEDCVECVGEYTESDYVELTTSPVNLDLLFYEDDPVKQAQNLNFIGNNSWGWMLTPWGGHFISSHFEGADKWYFYSDRPLELYAPLGGSKIKEYRVNDGTETQVNGKDVIVDVRLVVDIGVGCAWKFQHLTILKTLHEELSDNKYTFTEGEHLGYPTQWSPDQWTVDFHYQYNGEDICPYPALSSEIQSNISNLYDLQYQRAKIAGVYPQSKLCNRMNISIADSFWGVWEYKTGPHDSFMNQVDRIFGTQGGGFTFLSRDLSNPDTFHKDLNNNTKDLSPDVIGLFRDADGEENPGYDKLGTCMVKLIEGDLSEGILELITTGHWGWEYNTSVFARFSLDVKGKGLGDDLLTIEYFSLLIDAQAGFTENAIVYQRFLGYLSLSEGILIIALSSSGAIVVVVGIILTIVFVRKRKRK